MSIPALPGLSQEMEEVSKSQGPFTINIPCDHRGFICSSTGVLLARMRKAGKRDLIFQLEQEPTDRLLFPGMIYALLAIPFTHKTTSLLARLLQ